MPSSRRRFSIARFSIAVVIQFALLVLALRTWFPAMWARQWASGLPGFLAVFLLVHLGTCFFEWFFHRYVLHGITTPWLRRFARGHRNHHRLTAIKLRPAAPGSDRFILNEYPIMGAEQYPDSNFPVYALVAFWLVYTPGLAVLQRLMPGLPWMLAGYAAVTWSLTLYEVLHAIEHRSYEWWRHAIDHPRFGGLWRRLYGFHHMHHTNVGCNEAISGFFGLPLPDWCFGTYYQPRDLMLEGRVATARDFAVPAPHPIVRWLDRWARARETRILRGSG